ncbi:MAG: hypothetical protein CO128_07615, partial [Ignavibacteriales bacterium CG_4_9_14_3_um_filter_30_11]
AEIISTIFSNSPGNSFYNLLKHALLIPIVFTTVSVIPNIERAKTFFKFYLGAALFTVIIYLVYAYKYYIFNLYSVEQSGPSLFQYPITASEITIFTVLFFFAFLVNEKGSFKNRILLFLGFSVSLLALFSTYKRTGWMGAAFGILIILILKKQWKILIPLVVLVLVVLFLQNNISEVSVYDITNNELNKSLEFKTDGRVNNILLEDNLFYVSDFEKGIKIYQGSSLINSIILPSPVVSFNKLINNKYLAQLVDTRFVVLNKEANNLEEEREIASPGFTTDYKIYKNDLYVLDSDSGLTIFNLADSLLAPKRFNKLEQAIKFYIDSNYVVFFSPPKKILVYNNLFERVVDYENQSNIDFIFYLDGKIFISDKNGLGLFTINNKKFIETDRKSELRSLNNWTFSQNHLFASSLGGYLYEFNYPVGDKLEIKMQNQIGYGAKSLVYSNNKIYTTFIKRSRLLSIFDPYLPSNSVRFKLWEAGWKIFLNNPIIGVGDIDLQNLYKEYKNYYDKEIQGHMHNNFIHVLVTLGLFGFIAVVYLFYKVFIIQLKIYKETLGQKFVSSYSLGALASFCAFVVAGLTEMNFGDHEIITLVWFTLGLNIALFKLSNKNKEIYTEQIHDHI